MTAREIWNSLDAGWRRAFKKTMRRWMKHVEHGGYWTGERAGCFLCTRASWTAGYCSATCPLGKEREHGCAGVAAYCNWEDTVDALIRGEKHHKPLPEAKAVLRYLCGFPPPSDKTRQAAEKLLGRKKT